MRDLKSFFSLLVKKTQILLTALVFLPLLGCAKEPTATEPSFKKLPEHVPRGYVKFFRSGPLDFAQHFKIYEIHYGKDVLIGEITGNDTALCFGVRPGINMFKIIAPKGKKDLETLTVEEDLIIRVDIQVAWSHGHRFDYNIPYRWDVVHPIEAEELERGECADQIGSSPPQYVEPPEAEAQEDQEAAEASEPSSPPPSPTTESTTP